MSTLPFLPRLSQFTSAKTFPPKPVRRYAAQPFYPPRTRIQKMLKTSKRFVGYGSAFIVVSVAGLFVYDACTYPGSRNFPVPINPLALNPRTGGPKNLPIAELLLDDVNDEDVKKQKLVILGSGFAAISLAKTLDAGKYHVVLISPSNYFLFTPLLPSATVGTVEPRSIIEPVRKIVNRCLGHYLEASALGVELKDRLVEVVSYHEGKERRFYVPYDKLVISVGAQSNTHGVPGLENCYFLKTLPDAIRMRKRIMGNFEKACLPTTSPKERKKLLSFVVCGAGPTGVEFAAELHDMVKEDLVNFFPKLLRQHLSIHIIQSQDHILNTYDEKISKYAESKFVKEGIDLITNARVKEVQDDRVIYTQKQQNGQIIEKEVEAGAILWSTGLALTPLTHSIVSSIPEQRNKKAIETDSHLRVLGAPSGEVYAIGDCATVQNNISSRLVHLLQSINAADGEDSKVQLSFQQWRNLAERARRKFPQASVHLQRLDKLFLQYDKDNSGTLDMKELEALFNHIDRKLTSLPTTAQRGSQQGKYLGKKLNKLADAQINIDPTQFYDGDLDDTIYKPFDFHNLGSLAYLGDAAAYDSGTGTTFAGGLLAMYLWRSVYWSEQISFRTRCLLAVDWMKRSIWGRDLSKF
ncbi:External alternative NAD(P)H-ubiquinone oxidoreductase B1, mitochondrial [Neolecta irregularis DAH-3]|uniref:External alternative NAD(P)H-ubiquinone oxidoreductase B1, mitochondrial n=1 Tax=Neolecta irregularis (strain DAH-3) TaxID=1198029 RepID=A0A1U7LNW9_NEOID|nr:External alternative NAD(P)H-ubiquinone oxidoreductase B1, mitochondrial [Neolecta irregularis DAH-3]|eukprot:OLL24347.1 External alternative NAD(P)H-ubiquinone oxidoreductase B1, mitochondrial [Neolecta irregularis DAH-3]